MKPFAIAALAASALALTGCNGKVGSDPQLAVVAGYIQMGATPDSPAAGYFTIKGGPQDVELVAVTSTSRSASKCTKASRKMAW